MKTKIMGLILARNEEDILGECLEHHIREGVSQFIFTDNASVDSTRRIAEKFPEVVKIIDEPRLTYNQDRWATRMARMACDYSPDWLVVIDADEFWYGLESLDEVAKDVGTLVVRDFYLHPPTDKIKEPFHTSQMPFFDKENRQFGDDLTGRLLFRPSPTIDLAFGQHHVKNVPGRKEATDKINIHHYPNRAYDRFEQKIINGVRSMIAGGHGEGYAYHWRKLYDHWQKGELREKYNEMCVK